MKDHYWKKYWIQKIKNDSKNLNIKFKSTFKGSLPLEIDEDIYYSVQLEEFVKIEPNRIPLFLGSQFGIARVVIEISNVYKIYSKC
jgi:hypothetical protein